MRLMRLNTAVVQPRKSLALAFWLELRGQLPRKARSTDDATASQNGARTFYLNFRQYFLRRYGALARPEGPFVVSQKLKVFHS